MKYGIERLNPKYFGGKPDLVASGPNQNYNIGVPDGSGTIAAARAASKLGIPGIAFSGATNTLGPWSDPAPLASQIYAGLATDIILTLLRSDEPALPERTFLDVNFSPVSESQCSSVSDFKYIMTKARIPSSKADHDFLICGKGLPQEQYYHSSTNGCFATLSLINTDDGDHTAERKKLQEVYSKLDSILSCPMDVD